MATEYKFLSAGASGGARRSGDPRPTHEPVLRIAVGKRHAYVEIPLTRDEALKAAITLIEVVQRAYRAEADHA